MVLASSEAFFSSTALLPPYTNVGFHGQVDDVEVNPILLQKGATKVALYGMGSMRDERLNRMWQQKKASEAVLVSKGYG